MHFSFQDQLYEQVKGAAMGSTVRPIVANLYMEYLEQKDLSTVSLCTGNPSTWTSTYIGTVTTTSQQSLVLLTPSPIGSIQYVAILSFSAKRKPTSGRH